MRTALVMLIALAACSSDSRDVHITAATAFTQHYSQSRLGKWNVRASAVGADCGVLLVEAAIIMDDSMVDAMHHGTGAYDVYPGGVHQFSQERSFRAIAYRDPSGRVWTYGPVPASDPNALAPCH